MIQSFATGIEVTAGVIDTSARPTALSPVEILPQLEMYDYYARYTAGATALICPAPVTDDVAAVITACALTANAALGGPARTMTH